MAHFCIAHDPDPQRRTIFLAQTTRRLQQVPHLTLRQIEHGDFGLIIGHGMNAPLDVSMATEAFAVLIGYAVDGGGKKLSAADIAQPTFKKSDGAPAGYHAFIRFTKETGLCIAADLLGLFPVYHAAFDGGLIAGSSPELFNAHPLFERRLDMKGLIGILYFNGVVNDQPLLQGVKRLRSGHRLQWTPDRQPEEHENFDIGSAEPNRIRSIEEAREQASAHLARTVREHRPPTRSTILLSGGLDSRLMAGYLRAANIIETAVCLGRPTDLEVQVGGRVAAALGLQVQREPTEPDPQRIVAAARRIAAWEHLGGGFSHLEMDCCDVLAQAAPAFWSGFAVEDVLGTDASAIDGPDARTGQWSFDQIIGRLNAWGLPSTALESLFGETARKILPEIIEQFRHEHARHSNITEAQRSNRTKILNRARFHVGSVLHRLSFQSWPLMPLLDRHLLQDHFAMATELKFNRRLEKALICQQFPDLARIPREHNSFTLHPLTGSPFSGTIARLQKRFRRWYWQTWRREEPRRYYRCYDMNDPQWKAVRAEAEPYRKHLAALVDPRALNTILPPPEKRIELPNSIAGSGGRRLLLGLMLWTEGRI